MTWLVTGGAGYIGSHVVRAFGQVGLETVVLDDLSSGHRAFVPDGVPLVEGSILDTDLVADTLVQHGVVGVVHLAGFKYAGVSVDRPLHTYDQNVTGTAHLLEAMASQGVDAIVFSSSAAVYGTPDVDLVTETTATTPESPYGESKLIGEWLLRDQGRAVGLRHTSLRYFNVVGSATPDLYDTSPHNLFPLVLDALAAGRTPRINGTDYATPDGTCVRDYIHVADLADSHVAAAQALAAGRTLEPVYNLGSGDRRLGAGDHDRDGRGHGHPVRAGDRARAARATPPASWRRASWRPATSTGRCATPCWTWSPAPGKPARPTEPLTRDAQRPHIRSS